MPSFLTIGYSDPHDWSQDDVVAWLQHLHLHKYVDLIHKEEVNGAKLIEYIDNKALHCLGIDNALDSKKITKHIKVGITPDHEFVNKKRGNTTIVHRAFLSDGLCVCV